MNNNNARDNRAIFKVAEAMVFDVVAGHTCGLSEVNQIYDDDIEGYGEYMKALPDIAEKFEADVDLVRDIASDTRNKIFDCKREMQDIMTQTLKEAGIDYVAGRSSFAWDDSMRYSPERFTYIGDDGNKTEVGRHQSWSNLRVEITKELNKGTSVESIVSVVALQILGAKSYLD